MGLQQLLASSRPWHWLFLLIHFWALPRKEVALTFLKPDKHIFETCRRDMGASPKRSSGASRSLMLRYRPLRLLLVWFLENSLELLSCKRSILPRPWVSCELGQHSGSYRCCLGNFLRFPRQNPFSQIPQLQLGLASLISQPSHGSWVQLAG